ncbi:MAG: Xaa-Pro peptidase family protein [Actinomycetota bacterium]|nr:Xaa-Pro peptidase family protein [Actinomycetota bacterium]
MNNEARVTKLRAGLAETQADGLLVVDLDNVRYLTGFSGSNGQVLITPESAQFFTDGRYRAQAQQTVQGTEVVVYSDSVFVPLRERLAAGGIKKLGIEASAMTVADHHRFAGKLDDYELIATTGVVEKLRRAKDADEVDLMRRAVEITDSAFEWVLDRLMGGPTEREVALELEVKMRRDGADEVSFTPIVGSGPLSAHIHHTPSDRQLEPGDLVLLDFGCRVEGYCSDLTRTVCLGGASSEQKEMYATVLSAQLAGLEAVGAGVPAGDVDAAARRIIDAAGHGDDFGHGLGHGLGLNVHEAPRLHWSSEDTLAVGDVCTVEPGIYVIGSGGIRIEDDVLVTQTGSEALNLAPKKELLEL